MGVAIPRFKLRVSHLLSRCSITLAIPPALFYFRYFSDIVTRFSLFILEYNLPTYAFCTTGAAGMPPHPAFFFFLQMGTH
jgi:hypothetical protein